MFSLILFLFCFLEAKSPETLRKQLQSATASKDRAALEKAIRECEAAQFPELGSDLGKARDTLESLGGDRRG